MFRVFLVLTMSLLSSRLPAAEPEARTFKNAAGQSLPYRFIQPDKPEAGKKYPLVLILHGAGERGSDNRHIDWFYKAKGKSLLTEPAFLESGAFVLMPQCPAGEQWVNVPWAKGSYQSPEISSSLKLALELVETTMKEQPIDPDRVYVTGLSMGGYGTFDAIQRRPDLFAAAIPICGGGDPAKARDIAHIPLWAFHGDKDNAVPPAASRDMIEALKKAGGNPKYTEYPGVGHNSWSPAFAEKDFWPWLLSQKRKR